MTAGSCKERRIKRLTLSVRRWVLLAAGLGCTLVGTASVVQIVQEAPAGAWGLDASGFVSCANNWPVVGVWVNAGGSSGWATLGSAGHGLVSYDRSIDAHPTYTLNVGCGGTPQHWATSNFAQGGLLGMLADETYLVNCNDHGSCSAGGFDPDFE